MPECQGRCPVHKAPIDKVRGAYTRMIMSQYDHELLNTVIVRTSKIMLEDDCSATKPCVCKILDDQDAETLERAAVRGQAYRTEAEQWLRLVFEGIDGHTPVS